MKHKVEEVVLKGGGKGLLIDVPGSTVMNFDFQLNAGYYLSSRDKWETAHLMEHLLLGANEEIRRGKAFKSEFEKNGANCDASVDTYNVNYYSECAEFEWDRVLEMMILAISKPIFKSDEFKAEYSNVKDELSADQHEHFRDLYLRLLESMGMLGVNDKERIKLMKNVTKDDVRRHYNKTHLNGNFRFAIAGDLDRKRPQILKLLNTKLDLDDGERFELPEETPQTLDDVLYVPKKEVDNVYFFIDAYADHCLNSKEEDALSLLTTLLAETWQSRIFGEARERGIVYAMASNISHFKNTSSWWFGAPVMKDNAKELLSLIRDEVQRVLDGEIDDEDIESAKKYRLGQFQKGIQTVGSLSRAYSKEYFFFDDYTHYDNVPDRINKVTKADMVEVARQMFSGAWGMGVLGDCGKDFARELRQEITPLWDE